MYKQTPKRTLASASERNGIKKPNLTASAITNSSYSGELNWYNNNPCEEISIEEFEEFALDRLQVLRALETATISNKSPEAVCEIFQRVSRDHLPLPMISSTSNNESILRKDMLSHYILRLAFCRSDELRRWFIKFESLLFNMKFNMAQSSTKDNFIKMLGSKFEVVSDYEKEQLRPRLNACKFLGYRSEFDSTTFFKIPFERVASLVASRQVYMAMGFAYVPSEYASSWITGEFKSNLEAGLLELDKTLPQLEINDSLLPVLDAVTKKSFSTYDVSASEKVAGQVDAQDVPKLEVHFPPCMKNLATALKSEHHLKHDGRMQFGLFLKGIGMPLEQALEFWRMAFVKMNDEEFKKGYAYNIRHNYGQEGNRKNYSPYGCEKIIHSSNVGAGQHHGCPFKNFNSDRLRAGIQALNATVTKSEIDEVTKLATLKNYNVACSKYFELTHPSSTPQAEPTSLAQPITHPNQFFELSYKFSQIASQKQ